MVKNKQVEKSDWEKRRVQRVLDYHNKKYGTHIAIDDKTQNVRPDLKGKSDWDWVCHDTGTGDEVAIEVKNLTEQALEEKDNTTYRFLKEITSNFETKLPGTFYLSYNIPSDYVLPVKGHKDKKELRTLLSEVICRTAPRLQIGENVDLDRRIRLMLRIMKKTGRRFYIPQTLSCTLVKINNEGSLLSLGSGMTYWQSPEIKDAELDKFEKMVSHANEQLQKANTKETFLVFIEGHSGREPSALAKAFSSIKLASYSGIKYVYFVMVEKVTEIPLPAA